MPSHIVSLIPSATDTLVWLGVADRLVGVTFECAALAAVQAGRCHAVDADALIVRPGPGLVDGVETLARLLHPGQFGTDLIAGFASS